MSKYVLEQMGDSEEAQARDCIKPGMILYGYCGGLFGRDSYGEKVIKEVHLDHLVVIEDGHILVSRDIDSWIWLIEASNNALKDIING